MKMPTLKRVPVDAPIAQPVSIDAVAVAIGGSAEEILARGFVPVGQDFMGRALLAASDAKLIYDAAMRKQNNDALLPVRYEAYCDDRKRRLFELQAKATAEARASFVGPHAGGQQLQAYLETQWRAERKVRADFEADEPELTISQFREKEKQL